MLCRFNCGNHSSKIFQPEYVRNGQIQPGMNLLQIQNILTTCTRLRLNNIYIFYGGTLFDSSIDERMTSSSLSAWGRNKPYLVYSFLKIMIMMTFKLETINNAEGVFAGNAGLMLGKIRCVEFNI